MMNEEIVTVARNALHHEGCSCVDPVSVVDGDPVPGLGVILPNLVIVHENRCDFGRKVRRVWN